MSFPPTRSTTLFLTLLLLAILSGLFVLTPNSSYIDVSSASEELQIKQVGNVNNKYNSECHSLRNLKQFSSPSSLYDNVTLAEKYVFHLLLLYPEIKANHLCVVEGLIHHINADSRKSDVRIIIWISSQDGPKVKQTDSNLFKEMFSSAEFKIDFKFLNATEMMKGTDVGSFYACMNVYNNSLGEFKKQNIGNAVRLAILYKMGGFYLDWDFLISGNPLVDTQNLAFQDPAESFLNNAAMKFNKGSKILSEIMKEFVTTYDGNKWGFNGPQCLKRTFKKRVHCPRAVSSKDPMECKIGNAKETILISSAKTYYPIPYERYERMAKPLGRYKDLISNDARMIHLWNHLVEPFEIEYCKKSVREYKTSQIGQLRGKHCPKVFNYIVGPGNCTF